MHNRQTIPAHVAGSSVIAMAMVSSVLAMVDRLLADTQCDQPAAVKLLVGGGIDAGGKGILEIHFAGNAGTQAIVFASGTTSANVADAIQSFAQETGIQATFNELYGADLFSMESGSRAFVSVQQLGGPFAYVCAADGRPCGVYDYTGMGIDGLPGDANCDWIVNLTDLTAVLDGWGQCPQPPEICPGDVDASGSIDVDDLLGVINHWGM